MTPAVSQLVRFAVSLGLAGWASAAAAVPWTTYEAEAMQTTGLTSGPMYLPGNVAAEASGRKCVVLRATGEYVQFTAQAAANALMVRYCLPDSSDGKGIDATLSLYQNGGLIGKLSLTSKYCWLYDPYPFSNTPGSGTPRNFFDETRTNGLAIGAADVIRLQRDDDDTAPAYIIDFVDLENVAAQLSEPTNSLSIMTYGANGTGAQDDTSALQRCILAAASQRKSVWLPRGIYKVTAPIDLPSNLTIQGAGMWYTTLVGDPALYRTSSRRVTLNGNGSNIHLADFAILGKLNYRNDNEPNDGLGGSFGTGSTISRVWVEHTKAGAWLVNSRGLVVDSCRFRNTIADGINLCVGMRSTLVTNCTARGTGDDCFAIWPATYASQTYAPGLNVITHCRGELAFLANGGAIYGGDSNRIEDCLFQDMTYGCGILISTTFPVGNNKFAGTTIVQRCDLDRCGGYDPGWGLRAALQLCLHNKSLSGLNISHLNISNSISDGVGIVAPGSNPASGLGTLSNATMLNVNIRGYGIGADGCYGLWVSSDALGSLTATNSTLVDYRNDSPNFAFNTYNLIPPRQGILGMGINSNGSVTLTYATTPGCAYHLEVTTNLSTATWSIVSGSAATPTDSTVTFTDTHPPAGRQVFYRAVSP